LIDGRCADPSISRDRGHLVDADLGPGSDEPFGATGQDERASGGADGADGRHLALGVGTLGARSGQLAINVRATAPARSCSRMSAPIMMASLTEPETRRDLDVGEPGGWSREQREKEQRDCRD
jgi:hypothetical protein